MRYFESKMGHFNRKLGVLKFKWLSIKKILSFQLKIGNQNKSLEKVLVPINFITNIFNEN